MTIKTLTGLRRIKSIYGNACARCKQRQCPAWCSGSERGLMRARMATYGVFDFAPTPDGPQRVHDLTRELFDAAFRAVVLPTRPAAKLTCARCGAEADAHVHRCAAREPAGNGGELAPGWTLRRDCATTWDHVTGAVTWARTHLDGNRYGYDTAGGRRSEFDDDALTRDEAMALALGWACSSDGQWQARAGQRNWCVGPNGLGGISAHNGVSYTTGYASIPHAIAWCLESAKPAPESRACCASAPDAPHEHGCAIYGRSPKRCTDCGAQHLEWRCPACSSLNYEMGQRVRRRDLETDEHRALRERAERERAR